MLKRGAEKKNVKIQPKTNCGEGKQTDGRPCCVALEATAVSADCCVFIYFFLVSSFGFTLSYTQLVLRKTPLLNKLSLFYTFRQILCNKLCTTCHGRDFCLSALMFSSFSENRSLSFHYKSDICQNVPIHAFSISFGCPCADAPRERRITLYRL